VSATERVGYLRQARCLLDRHFAEPFDLDWLAAESGFSKFHFALYGRWDRLGVGLTPNVISVFPLPLDEAIASTVLRSGIRLCTRERSSGTPIVLGRGLRKLVASLNAGAERITGCRLSEIIGRNFSVLY